MTEPSLLRTPYQRRVQLVVDTVVSNTELGHDDASKLAVEVLHAIDSIPEKMR